MSGKIREKIFSLKNIPKIVKDIAAIITATGVITGAIITCSSFISSKITESVDKKLDNISRQLDSIELNSTRNQLLTLMSNYPDNKSEILKVAYHYFKNLNGDWYVSELFDEWAKERNIDVSHIMTIEK